MCSYRKKIGFKNRNPGPGCLICGQPLLYALVKPPSTLFSKRLGLGTLAAREFSCAVSGFGKVFMVNRAARDFGWRRFSLRRISKHPAAREKKPLVPRLRSRFPLAFKLFCTSSNVYCSLIALFFCCFFFNRHFTGEKFRYGMTFGYSTQNAMPKKALTA